MNAIPRRLTLLLLTGLSSAPLAAADGDADPTFSEDGQTTYTISPPSAFGEAATAVAGLADGSLLVGGRSAGPGVGEDFAVVRYTRSGAPDLDFGSLGSRTVDFGSGDALTGIAVQGDGRIVLAGASYVDAAPLLQLYPALARLTPDGDLDPTFDGDGRLRLDAPPWPGAEIQVGDGIEVATTGKLVLHGRCRLCPSNADWRMFVVRLLADGTLDATFDADGWYVLPVDLENLSHRALALDAANRPLLAAILPDPDFTLSFWRLTTAGALDPTFGGGDGRVDTAIEPGNLIQLLASADDGRLYVRFGLGVWRFLADGGLDTSYGDDGFAGLGGYDEGSAVLDIALQADGKLVGAGIINPNGADAGDFFLARLLADGTLDVSFAGNGLRRVPFDVSADGTDLAEAVTLSGGRLVAVGYATEAAGGESRFAILRTENAMVFADGFERGSTAGWTGN
jgi:uncharacterized delta-60 repeat protein